MKKRLCSFSGPHCGLKKSWRSKKRHAAAENKMDQSRGLEKDISGSKKRAARGTGRLVGWPLDRLRAAACWAGAGRRSLEPPKTVPRTASHRLSAPGASAGCASRRSPQRSPEGFPCSAQPSSRLLQNPPAWTWRRRGSLTRRAGWCGPSGSSPGASRPARHLAPWLFFAGSCVCRCHPEPSGAS